MSSPLQRSGFQFKTYFSPLPVVRIIVQMWIKWEEKCLPKSSDKQLPSLCRCLDVSAFAAAAADPPVSPETELDQVISPLLLPGRCWASCMQAEKAVPPGSSAQTPLPARQAHASKEPVPLLWQQPGWEGRTEWYFFNFLAGRGKAEGRESALRLWELAEASFLTSSQHGCLAYTHFLTILSFHSMRRAQKRPLLQRHF